MTVMNAIEFNPRYLQRPAQLLNAPTAWDGCEMALADIVARFCPRRAAALEFGVQHAFSTVALANYFQWVTGIDTFLGDPQAGEHPDNFMQTLESVAPYPNIVLVQSDWRAYVEPMRSRAFQWDLIHVDIYHTYQDTYECGKWALAHSPCVLFHDTQSFPEVGQAVGQLAQEFGRPFRNWGYKHGLAILAEYPDAAEDMGGSQSAMAVHP